MKRFVAAILGVAIVFGWGVYDLKAEESKDHHVVRGDTLWDLSESYLKNPLLWPKIWNLNPHISDPHEISPGQIVKIPSLEAKPALETLPEGSGMAMEKPAPPAPPAEVIPPAPKVTIDLSKAPPPIKIVKGPEPVELPEEEPTVEAALAEVYDRGIGIVTNDIPSQGRILHTEAGWGSVGVGASILIDAPGAVVGQQYGIYRDMGKVKHPHQWRSPGHLVSDVGIIEVVASDSLKQIGRVVRAFTEVETGDLLGPIPPMPVIVPSKTKTKMIKVDGTIIALQHFRSIATIDDIVYIDLGKENGLVPGDKLFVKSRNGKEDKRVSGEIMVLRLTPKTAAALVTNESAHEMLPGDIVERIL